MATDAEDAKLSAQTSYVFVRVLGKGAFGEAVLYRKTDDNSLVVWKEVNLTLLNEKAGKDAQNEIDILSLLNHANIVSYYNHFVDDNTYFIEMEYANGGTLYDKIGQSAELFQEQQVVWYLFQITSALNYVHQYGIIHRDIKTQNIFLTKVGLLKLGDFGISKMLESKGEMADSIVGTPYYMSPELVKGERYSFKSDVWALGCVLFELLTLTRTFQASNPLKLAFEIVQAEHESIDCRYSEEMQTLVNGMLRKEPNERPSVEDILHNSLFSDAVELERKVWELNSSSRKLRLSTSTSSVLQPVVTSKMCEVYQWGGGKVTPQKLEIFTREKSPILVAAGHYHFAAITFEKELYTWANAQGTASICGQLGHGDCAAYKAPKRVDSLLGCSIQQVACGQDFTLCLSDEGVLYGFGSNYYGCVGGAGEDELLLPRTVDFFLDHPVEQVSCGDAHVVVLTRYGDVYTWGSGEFGKLGLGSEDDFDTPQKVDLPGKHLVKDVIASPDGTFLVCANGRVLACGSNEFNKLGFNSETSGLRKRKDKTYDIPCKSSFTTVKPLSHTSIVTLAAGTTHSAAIDCYGQLFTFGSNRYGQLGLGDFRCHVSVNRVCGVLVGRQVIKVACGDSFTVITTSENMVYACGLGESGRLGADFSDKGGGPGGQCMAIPRPIFGSMHIVPCLASCYWNTIIIAEKVLNSKILKTQDSRVSLSSPKVSSDAVFELSTPSSSEAMTSWSDSYDCDPEAIDYQPLDQAPTHQIERLSFPESSSDIGESSIPPWLEQELQEAEVIPLPQIQATPATWESADSTPVAPVDDSLQNVLPDRETVQPSTQECVQDQTRPLGEEGNGVADGLVDHNHHQLLALLAYKEDQITALQKTVSELKLENSKLREALRTTNTSSDG